MDNCKEKHVSDLEQFMVEEWSSIPDNILINLVELMPQCCQLVIEETENILLS